MDPQKFKNHCLKYLCPPNSILLSFLFSLWSMILFSCMISSTPMVSWNISRSQIHIFKALRLYTRLPSGCLYFEVLETAQRSKHQNETIFFPPNHYSFCIPCLNERPYYQPTWDRNPKAISDSFLFLIALPPRSLSILLSSYLSNPFSSLSFLFLFSFFSLLPPSPPPSFPFALPLLLSVNFYTYHHVLPGLTLAWRQRQARSYLGNAWEQWCSGCLWLVKEQACNRHHH